MGSIHHRFKLALEMRNGVFAAVQSRRRFIRRTLLRESISVQTPATKCGHPVHSLWEFSGLPTPISIFLLYDAFFFFLLSTFTFNYIVGSQNREHILEQPRDKSAYCKRDCIVSVEALPYNVHQFMTKVHEDFLSTTSP